MRIGELAQATGTPIETIRFYEREGLLPAPARTREQLPHLHPCACRAAGLHSPVPQPGHDAGRGPRAAALQGRAAGRLRRSQRACSTSTSGMLQSASASCARWRRELRRCAAACAVPHAAAECGILQGHRSRAGRSAGGRRPGATCAALIDSCPGRGPAQDPYPVVRLHRSVCRSRSGLALGDGLPVPAHSDPLR